MSESYIAYNAKGEAVSFVGEDATRLYQAALLKGAIKLWIDARMIPTRGMTISKMLAMASTFSQKKYSTRKPEAAIMDLDAWIAAMQTAIPHKKQGEA